MIVIENEDFDIEMVLTSIKEKQLNGEIWYLETEKEIVPHPREYEFQAVPINGYESLYSCLSQHLKYPKSARKMGIQGIVYISFTISEKGSILESKILRGLQEEMNSEALSAFLECDIKWKPAVYNNDSLSSQIILPITFKLTN